MQPDRRKILLVIISTISIALVVTAVIWTRLYSSKITIQISPADSVVTINGKRRAQGTINVRPGTYSVVGSRQGFESQSKSVSVVKAEIKYVGLLLVSNSPATANWYIDHPSDAKILEGISSNNYDLFSTEQTKKYPLIKSLPFIDQLYRVDYGRSQASPNNLTAVGFYVKYYSELGKQQALEWLKFKGYEPESLEIIYIDTKAQ